MANPERQRKMPKSIRILSHRVLSKQKDLKLATIKYCPERRMAASIEDFESETASTIFVNGTVAIVSGSCPEQCPLSAAMDYLANAGEPDIEIRFYDNYGNPSFPPAALRDLFKA